MLACDRYTHCVVTGDSASCAPNSCAELGCDVTEVCTETAEGACCRALTCEAEVECDPGEYCSDTQLCEPQQCEPGERGCDGNLLIVRDERGAAEFDFFECGSGASCFESACVGGAGQAACTCEDDWDCPAFTRGCVRVPAWNRPVRTSWCSIRRPRSPSVISTTTAAPGVGLLPRASLLLSINGYAPANNGQDLLPTQPQVVVDSGRNETECREDNNSGTADVVDGEDLPDLTVVLGRTELTCPDPTLSVTQSNGGSSPASNVAIGFYAGDPRQGGELVHSEVFAGRLEAGSSETLDVEVPLSRSATIYATVEYTQSIEECNDGNNTSNGVELHA